jgi:hypothetical protein
MAGRSGQAAGRRALGCQAQQGTAALVLAPGDAAGWRVLMRRSGLAAARPAHLSTPAPITAVMMWPYAVCLHKS